LVEVAMERYMGLPLRPLALTAPSIQAVAAVVEEMVGHFLPCRGLAVVAL